MSHNTLKINNLSPDINSDFSILPSLSLDSTGSNSSITTYTGIEEIHLIDNSTNTVNITIPAGNTVGTGYKYQIKLGSAGVSIAPVSGTIDTISSFSLTSQFDSITLVSDGSNWFLI